MDWKELSDLYVAAPLGYKTPSDLKVAFSNSMFTCFAFESERLIGAGGVLADGEDGAYVCDMAAHPSHQGTGIGRVILAELVNRSHGYKKIIWAPGPAENPSIRNLASSALQRRWQFLRTKQVFWRTDILRRRVPTGSPGSACPWEYHLSTGFGTAQP